MAIREPETAAELAASGKVAAASADDGRSAAEVVREWLRGAFVDNAALKFVAFVLALTVFILVHSDEDAIQPVTVKLRYATAASGLTLVSQKPSVIRADIQGSRRRLKRLKESDLDIILVTLTNSGEFVFQPEMVRPLPSGIEVASISPPSISLLFERTADKAVPVRVKTVGSPAEGYRVDRIVVDPPTLEIRGAESKLAKTFELVTQPISVADASQALTRTTVLEVPPFAVEVVREEGGAVAPQQVEVAVTVEVAPIQSSLELPDLAVNIVAVTPVPDVAVTAWKVDRETVTVLLRGPGLTLDALDASSVGVRVRLYPGDVATRAARSALVEVVGLPEGIAAEVRPAEVALAPK